MEQEEKTWGEVYSNLIVSYIDSLLLFFNFYFIFSGPKQRKEKAAEKLRLFQWIVNYAPARKSKYNRKWIRPRNIFISICARERKTVENIVALLKPPLRNDSWLQINKYSAPVEQLFVANVFDFVFPEEWNWTHRGGRRRNNPRKIVFIRV